MVLGGTMQNYKSMAQLDKILSIHARLKTMLGGTLLGPPMYGLMLARWHTCMPPVQVLKHASCAYLHASHAYVLKVLGLDEILVVLKHLHMFKACVKIKIIHEYKQKRNSSHSFSVFLFLM